jgi:hypothetical protein
VTEGGPFAGALERVAQLRGLYDAAMERAVRRQPGWTVEQEEQRQRDSLLHQLDWASIASRVRRS